jgi:hypothetical protein
MERIVVAISPPSIFTLGSLRSFASFTCFAGQVLRLPTSGFLGCITGYALVMVWLCSGYAVGMVWVLSGASVVGGRNPPVGKYRRRMRVDGKNSGCYKSAVYIHSWFASLICFAHLLRRSSLTAADLGFFGVYHRLCSGFGLGLVWVWSGYRTKFRRGGAEPPAQPPP